MTMALPSLADAAILPDIVEDHEEDGASVTSSKDIPYTYQLTSSSFSHHELNGLSESEDEEKSAGHDVRESPLGKSASPNIEDEADYDTDIEIDEDELFDRDRDNPGDLSVGTEEYKRSCSRLNISPEMKVVENLTNNTLNLEYQGIGEDGAKALAKSLLKNTKVEKLKLEDNSITPLGCAFLIDMLCDNIYITYLDLSHNDVGTFGCLAFKEMFTLNTTLLTLIMKHCKIKDSDCAALAEGLQGNETLVYLDLSHNELCEEGAMCLGTAVAMNNSIEQLSLAWNHIRRKGAVQICKGLKRNYCLLKIDLSWNGLGYEGALSLGQSLKGNKYVKELDISNNRLTWNCATVLATGLRDNYTLEVLKVGHNPLTMTGVLELLTAVNNEHSEMEYMSFEGIPINRKIAYIAETLSNSREFSISHGGVIDVEDVLGKKHILQDDPLTRLMAFLNDRGVRAMDLFRSLEKDKDKFVSREQFISGLKKAEVPLETWEMVKVMEKLDKNEQGRIDYRKLSDGLHEQKIRNKLNADKAKVEARRKLRDERNLLNPELIVHRKSSEPPSAAGSVTSGANSRRASRVSLNISQNILDFRRNSTLSLLSVRSTATSPKGPRGSGLVDRRSSLAVTVDSQQKKAREGEMLRKLSRLSLPGMSTGNDNSKSQPSSRKMSLVNQSVAPL